MPRKAQKKAAVGQKKHSQIRTKKSLGAKRSGTPTTPAAEITQPSPAAEPEWTRCVLPLELNVQELTNSLFRMVDSRLESAGTFRLPGLPSLSGYYAQRMGELFTWLGSPWTTQEISNLEQLFHRLLRSAGEELHKTNLIIRYERGKNTRKYAVNAEVERLTLAQCYEHWMRTRTPPLFGANPDAKVLAVAQSLGVPRFSPVLDIGAGTGRNALPLARLGFPVDALEASPTLLDQLVLAARKEKRKVGRVEGSVLDPAPPIPSGYYALALAAEVTPHFQHPEALRRFLKNACQALRPGGRLLFNIFLAVPGYEPGDMARELASYMWSSIFTRPELIAACAGLPLHMSSDESAFEYERQWLPPEGWPPTGWFISWATGRNVYPLFNSQPPVELRWICCQRY